MEEILKVAPIKDRPIEGTNSLAFSNTLTDQKHLEVKMNDLKVKFHEVALQWDKLIKSAFFRHLPATIKRRCDYALCF